MTTNTDAAKAEYLPLDEHDAAAHMYPSDLEKFKRGEHFADTCSVKIGNETEESVGLYTVEQVHEAIDADRAQRAAPVAGVPVEPEVEKDWQEFWLGVVAPNGVVDMEQIKRELFDFHRLMGNAAKVYCHATGGRISKLGTDASVVCMIIDECQQECIDEAVAEEADSARSAAPDPAPVAPTDLHGAIMNLQVWTKTDLPDSQLICYKLGARDARHAAAELVSATPAGKGDVGLLREAPRATGQDMAAAAELMSKWGIEHIWQKDLEKVAVGLATLRQRLEGKE